jgi:CheY-like chemotaxis protein
VELGDLADLKGVRVLVVEDDVDAREMLVDVLAMQGADARGAANGVDAIDLVVSFRPDVLVSDIGLPDMDGYALLRRVRALGPDAGGTTRAIALTGYTDREDARRALAAGYELHVAKPVDAALLTRAVSDLSRTKR